MWEKFLRKSKPLFFDEAPDLYEGEDSSFSSYASSVWASSSITPYRSPWAETPPSLRMGPSKPVVLLPSKPVKKSVPKMNENTDLPPKKYDRHLDF